MAGVLAQVVARWARQAVLSRDCSTPKESVVAVIDAATARAVGELCARSRHRDVVDVHVVLDARAHGHLVVTSDPDDLRRVDPTLPLIVV